ncbi:MAG: NfeD family protein [Bacteroidales bacterium]
MRKTILTLLVLLLSLCSISAKEMTYYVIDLKKEIGSTTWLYVKNGLEESKKEKADAIFIHMNTYGGTVVFADSIRTALLNEDRPIYCFIDNNAASAGALIAIACDSIYMRSGANIGAATVVDQTGKQLPDKYQSYMRATIRSTAEAQGKDSVLVNNKWEVKWRRNPLIAEAMVDSRVVVPGLIDSTRVLTFTTEEAIKYGYCEAKAEDISEIIEKRLVTPEYKILRYKPTFYDELKGFIMNPALQAVLIMLIIGGIYFELQTPGLGFPSIVAIASAILYFAPLYIDGMAANWEIIIFIVGIILLVVEIFIIPGFGIFGISGIICIVGGLILAMLDNVIFSFDNVSNEDLAKALVTVLIGFLSGGVLLLYLASRIGKKGMFKKLALNTIQENDKGYISVDPELKNYMGKTGIASTVLRPSGKIRIGDEQLDAVSIDGFIEALTPVVVVKQESAQLYVKKISK